MRWIILFAALFALDVYVFQAFRLMIQGLSPSWRQGLSIVFWSIPVLAVGFFLLEYFLPDTGRPHPFISFTRAFIIGLYLFKVLALPLFLIDDLRRGVTWIYQAFSQDAKFDLSRSRFLSTTGILLGGVPFVALVYGMIRNPYRYKVFRSTIRIPNLPSALQGLRIVQISDIHSGSFTFKEPVRGAIQMINDLDPDLVFFTGDLVNNETAEVRDFLDVFDKIKARHGVYSVLGNHDYGDYRKWPSRQAKEANFQEMLETHRRLGWDLLNNEHRILEIDGTKLAVIGVENFSAKARFPKYGDLQKACAGCDEDVVLRLLLSHDPSHWEFEVLPQFPEIDITFSGHTHGMQFGVEIPGWIKWSPIKYMYDQWAGLYQRGKQHLYVNRGLGFIGYPGRVGILPEITCIELESE